LTICGNVAGDEGKVKDLSLMMKLEDSGLKNSAQAVG
jgi:hypothetical protein